LLRNMAQRVPHMRAAEKVRDEKALARIDMDFHRQFIVHCPNEYLRAGYDVIRWQLVAMRYRAPIDNAYDSAQGAGAGSGRWRCRTRLYAPAAPRGRQRAALQRGLPGTGLKTARFRSFA
jgi:DNA-binding GntR family transcriptional regulator